MRRTLVLTVAMLAAILGGASTASACTCISPGPPCQAFWKAEAVFDATVDRIEPTTRRHDYGDNRLVTLREYLVHLSVSQSWKGPATAPLEIVTADSGGMCGYEFKPGKRYLIFAHKRPLDGRWITSICSATREYDGAGETAAFLSSLAQPAKGGRIFGSLKAHLPSFVSDSPLSPQPIEARVRLFGAGREWRVSSASGLFEFTGLAAGPYRLELQLPEGYATPEPNRTIEVPNERACVQADYYLQPAGRIVGLVLDAGGRPAPRVAIEVTTPDARAHPMYGLPTVSGRTDENGAIEIRGLPPGRYIVGVNLADLPSRNRPIGRTLYPSDGSEPTIVTLGVAQTFDLGTWKLPPPLEAVNVQGVVLWPDGTPGAGVYVHAWDRTGNPTESARGVTGATADAEGRFTLELRRGRVYTFTAREKDRILSAESPRLDTTAVPIAPLRMVVRRGRPR
jgi:hypothetical protein